LDKIELIQGLIEKTKNLPHRNEIELDALKRRAEMIIRKIFEDPSTYLTDLKSISFKLGIHFAGMDGSIYDKSWTKGQGKMLNLFKIIKEELTLDTDTKLKNDRVEFSNKIFIVHGHEEEIKNQLEIFLNEIGLEAIVLHRKPDEGMTIIEKFEKHSKDASYAFILLTPDDICYSAKKKEMRARQNVIFEFGYFVGKLGRDRVCCIYKENISLPTDVLGMLYKNIQNKIEEKSLEILKELKKAGYNVEFKNS
jgi:predicted nucleotide-binding protein